MRQNIYTLFGSTQIPIYNRVEDISTPEAKSGVIETVGGYIDGYSGISPLTPKQVTIDCEVFGGTRGYMSTEAALHTWQALIGKKDKLYRLYRGSMQYAYARLMSVSAETSYESNKYVLHMTLVFELISPYWYDRDPIVRQNSYSIPASQEDVQVDLIHEYIDGNVDILDPIVEVTFDVAVPADCLTIGSVIGSSRDWYVPAILLIRTDIPANTKLLIDAGRKQATLYTSTQPSIYDYIELYDTHTSKSWLELVAGKYSTVSIVLEGITSAFTVTSKVTYSTKWR